MVTVSVIIIRRGREHSGCGNPLQKRQKAISQCGLEAISYFYEPRTCSGKGLSCITDLNRPICDVTAATHNPLAWLWPVLLQQDWMSPQMAPHPVVPDKHALYITSPLPTLCPSPLNLTAKLRLRFIHSLLSFLLSTLPLASSHKYSLCPTTIVFSRTPGL